MDKWWNKKRIGLLETADPATLDEFWSEMGPVFYTWMYYQVGADEQIAAELTGEAVVSALQNISQFDPATETFFQWIKQQARQTRDAELKKRQLKPQRPWAWSQLPKDVLDELSALRSEPLTERVAANSFVQEIVQAALVELESVDRKLMMHRYIHLDTEEQIAEEMRCSIEDVQNRLYRARHSFRREFFNLIATANTGFSEASATGEIEILDSNLEKLLRTTSMYQSPDPTQAQSMKERLRTVAEQVAESQPMRSNGHNRSVTAAAIVLVGAVILALVLFIASNNNEPEPSTTPPTATEKPTHQETVKTADSNKTTPSKDDIDKEEMELIFELGQAKDVEALLEILKSGMFPSQVAAAHFLGQFAGPEAIEPLERAEQRWYPDSPSDENFFAQAITAILKRHPELITDAETEDSEPVTETQPAPQETTPQPPASFPNVVGIVSDMANQPMANATLELSENPLFSDTSTGRTIATARTDPNGQFEFTETYEGPAYLTARLQGAPISTITRALWCRNESVCIVNPGGRPVLTGNAAVDGTALVNQTVYLSNTLDPALASYLQETITDGEGNFTFAGVQPGEYLLLKMGMDQRLHRLMIFEMPPQERFNMSAMIDSSDVVLEYPTDQQFPTPRDAELVYAANMPDNMNRFQASISDDGSVQFEDVIPGTYLLRVELSNGIWLQQDVEIASVSDNQVVLLDPVPEETVTLNGRFLSVSPIDLFLINANQQLYIDIQPQADGSYEIASIPADMYSLAAFVHGQLIEFSQIDLQSEIEMTMDIDPMEIIGAWSPQYVVVADQTGLILSGAQVWLTGNEQITTTTSTSKGAFLAVTPGSYTLSAAYPGYPTEEQRIEVSPGSLLAEPESTNTRLIQLGTEPAEAAN